MEAAGLIEDRTAAVDEHREVRGFELDAAGVLVQLERAANEAELVMPEPDDAGFVDPGDRHPLTVDERAVVALQVDDLVAAIGGEDHLGVVPRHGQVVERDLVSGAPADPNPALGGGVVGHRDPADDDPRPWRRRWCGRAVGGGASPLDGARGPVADGRPRRGRGALLLGPGRRGRVRLSHGPGRQVGR